MISDCRLAVLFTPLPWNYSHPHPHQLKFLVRCKGGGDTVLTRQGQRFLSSLATAAVARDSSATNRLIRKFVAGSPKSVALNALSYLLSPHSSYLHLSPLALSLYKEITEASWFIWNSKLVADLIALLNKQEQYEESQRLISQALFNLKSRDRDLALFYCNMIESNSRHGSKQGFDQSYAYITELLASSSSLYIKRQACKSMISGSCQMGLPHEAEKMVEEMRNKGLKPSLFECRSILYEYGKLGLLEDMERYLYQMEKDGLEIDTICSNMVLSSYGAHGALPEMLSWLQKMKKSEIPYSIRTYNSVLNHCPTIISLLMESNDYPLSVGELFGILKDEEVLLVKELIESSVLEDAMEWNAIEAKLDLHGMHVSSAYLIMIQWMEKTRSRFCNGKCVIPAEIVVVCGAGKHSNVRRESPVKKLVKGLMVRTGCPMRINRKNIGCFVAKGKVMKKWLC